MAPHKDNLPQGRIEHKGFIGEYKYVDADKVFFGTIKDIDDCITFEATSTVDIIDSFCDAVEDYIKLCEEAEKDTFFKDAYTSLCKMQEAKNKAYGESALQPLNIFSRHFDYGSRLDEKLARIKNCKEIKKNDVADLIGGLILLCKEKDWRNFDDLID